MTIPLRDVKIEWLHGNTKNPHKQGIQSRIITSMDMRTTYTPFQCVPVINLAASPLTGRWRSSSHSSCGAAATSEHITHSINKCIALYIRSMYCVLHIKTTTGHEIMNIQAIREAFDEITFIKDAYDGLERIVKDEYTQCLIHTLGNQFEARIAVLDQAIIEAEISGLEVETKEAANDE